VISPRCNGPDAFIPGRDTTVNRAANENRQPGQKFGASVATSVIGVTLAAAVAAPSLDRGGFTTGGQNLLLTLAAIALVETVLFMPGTLSESIRAPVAPVLLLLGVLAIVSAAWTIGPAGAAAHWGLVIVAYGVIAVCGYVFASHAGLWPIAIGIALLAALEAVLGLGSAALHERPWAELIGGSWRPGGTFEYSAALGLLQVCTLPVALRAASSASPRVTYVGALALVLVGATLGCADSRTDLGLAAVTLIFLGTFGDRRQLPPRVALASTGLLAVAIVAGALLLGRHTQANANGGGIGRVLGTAIACFALAMVWPALRALTFRLELRRAAVLTVVAIVGGGAIWLAIGYGSTLVSTGNGLDHGRISYWTAAVDAWRHRPILGSGASTFAKASARYQASGDRTLFAHNLPLELAAELGVLGFLTGLWLYAATARTLLRTISAPNAWLLAPTVGCFLLANLVDWPWHLVGMGAFWAAAAGGLGACSPSSDRSRAGAPR